MNTAFALVESIFYENDSAELSRKQFAEIVKSDPLLLDYLNGLDTSFRLDKTAKNVVYQAIITDTYLNQEQKIEQLNKHREALLTFRAYAVNKLLSTDISLLDMISMYAEATHYIKQTLKNDYPLIKQHELPAVQKIKRIFLKRQGMGNSSRITESSSTLYEVTLLAPSGLHVFNCAADEYILDAGLEAGVSLPYSGRSGTDGAAAGKLYSGTVNQDDQSYLSDCQIANGFVLLDVAYPTSDVFIMTHQEEGLNALCLNPVPIIGQPPINPFPDGWQDPVTGAGSSSGGNTGGGGGGGSGSGTGNPNPDPNPPCGVTANLNFILTQVTIGGHVDLTATINNVYSATIDELNFEVYYNGNWLTGSVNSSLTTQQGNIYTANDVQINVLGQLKYRLKVEFTCNGSTSTIYSNEVSTYSRYTAYEFTNKFASEMSSAWSQTKSSSIANPGTKYEYGFAGYFNAGTRQIVVDGVISSVSAPCGSATVTQGLPEKPVYSYTDPFFGNHFTVGNFHTHPPLTYCDPIHTMAPGPSYIDLGFTTKFPRIVRTYSQTVNGGHNINLPTTDHLTHAKSVTSY